MQGSENLHMFTLASEGAWEGEEGAEGQKVVAERKVPTLMPLDLVTG